VKGKEGMSSSAGCTRDGLRPLVSADAHIGIPLALADHHLSRYRDQVPHLEYRSDGMYAIYPQVLHEGTRTESGRSRATKVTLEELERVHVGNSKAMLRPSSLPAERLEEMGHEGVVAEVLLSNVTASHPDDDPDLERAYAEIRNDWLAEAFGGHLDRFAPAAHLPVRSVDGAVAELE
jgi:predicted TIM-barrel fold metal-dependent hydrolase